MPKGKLEVTPGYEVGYENGLLDFTTGQSFNAITLSQFFRDLGITLGDCRDAFPLPGGPPSDWRNYHHSDCGTKYRGCSPHCPKDIYERTGEWRPLS